jgi:hypothetical protein
MKLSINTLAVMTLFLLAAAIGAEIGRKGNPPPCIKIANAMPITGDCRSWR